MARSWRQLRSGSPEIYSSLLRPVLGTVHRFIGLEELFKRVYAHAMRDQESDLSFIELADGDSRFRAIRGKRYVTGIGGAPGGIRTPVPA